IHRVSGGGSQRRAGGYDWNFSAGLRFGRGERATDSTAEKIAGSLSRARRRGCGVARADGSCRDAIGGRVDRGLEDTGGVWSEPDCPAAVRRELGLGGGECSDRGMVDGVVADSFLGTAMGETHIRGAEHGDLARITEIYNHYVL